MEKEMATHSSFLARRIPGTRSLVGFCLWGRTESDTIEATWQQWQWQHGILLPGKPHGRRSLVGCAGGRGEDRAPGRAWPLLPHAGAEPHTARDEGHTTDRLGARRPSGLFSEFSLYATSTAQEGWASEQKSFKQWPRTKDFREH